MKKVHRFMVGQPLTGHTLSMTDEAVIHQIASVLRLKIGERVVLCDGKGIEVVARITDVSKRGVEVEVEERRENTSEPAVPVLLYCAMLKRENFEFVAQKATEVGVTEIVPVRSERTVKLEVKPDRLTKIIREAAEQSGRGRVPVLHDPLSFETALKQSAVNGINVLFEPGAAESSQTVFQGARSPIGVWVGPEGGWTEAELLVAKQVGFQIANLGKTILRAETAAIVASFLAVNS